MTHHDRGNRNTHYPGKWLVSVSVRPRSESNPHYICQFPNLINCHPQTLHYQQWLAKAMVFSYWKFYVVAANVNTQHKALSQEKGEEVQRKIWARVPALARPSKHTPKELKEVLQWCCVPGRSVAAETSECTHSQGEHASER